VHHANREAFAAQVHRAVTELQRRGAYPTLRLVLATIPQPKFRSMELIAETLRLVRHELSIKPCEAYHSKK
jgi:hypothetical protein